MQYTACLHTLKHDRRATRSNSKEEQAIRISKLGVSVSFHTSVGSIPLQTWTPHHSGAHRSDTPTLLHSFGRHPIPPRAYTLHQERSKQQLRGKRERERNQPFAPHLAFIKNLFSLLSPSPSPPQQVKLRRLARNRRPAVIVPRRAKSKHSRNRRGKSVVSLGFHCKIKDETKKRQEFFTNAETRLCRAHVFFS